MDRPKKRSVDSTANEYDYREARGWNEACDAWGKYHEKHVEHIQDVYHVYMEEDKDE